MNWVSNKARPPGQRAALSKRIGPATYRWVLKFAVSAALITWLLARSDLAQLGAGLRSLDRATVALALGIYALSILVAAAKWRVLVPGTAITLLSGLTLIGQFYAIVLPGQIAGEVMKAYRLGQGRVDAERIAASVVLDKATGLLALLLIGLAGLYATGLELPGALRGVLAVAFLFGVAGAISLAIPGVHPIIRRTCMKVAQSAPRLASLASRVAFFFDAWRDYLRRPRWLVLSVGIGVAYQLCNIAILTLVGSKIGIALPVADWFWIFCVVSLAVVLPLSIGGLGIREGAFVGVLGFLAIPNEQALALSFSVFGLQLCGALVGGLLEVVGLRGSSGSAGRGQ
jgi:hypothetical protein